MDTAETRFVEMIVPEQTNHYGALFGGNGPASMARAAFATATRRSRRSVVMAATERVDSTCRRASARSST
ncbi:acyl-CoA hydrolase [Amaricoccus macauensis]|uniref:Acyl-CoA hydrolase n=1 Tax=Amaricoccus macauensis TaxID=57001 RepID=A0A840SJY5_9RHOB|nr:hypothetical protein [Amaricoccus macauensis]MBB5221274.1 acyl-CoA hydrolase [Amaricoccus macauensis]